MQEYIEKNNKSKQDFISSVKGDFLNTELNFTSMNKGVLNYTGLYRENKLFIQVSEDSMSDMDFNATETLLNLLGAENVSVKVDNEIAFKSI